MNTIELQKDIYWVGAVDWNLRNFHGYLTQRGSSYNAYLIIDEKITLIDSVKPAFNSYLFDEISKIIDPSKIDYIVSNHTEMDHSGTLPELVKIAPNAKIVTSPNGKKGLIAHYKNPKWNFQIVNSGDTLNIGKRNLSFVLTPMVHWPDSMVSYLPEDKILFSNDAFGQHIASSERFDNEYSKDIIFHEAKKYYANIVLPYSNQVNKAVKAVSTLDVDIIAPSHGIIWKENIKGILKSYSTWCANDTENSALIIFDSMWGSTEKIAYRIYDSLKELNINSKIVNLQKNHISDIMTDLLTAKFVFVGSSTLNNNMLPTVAGFLTYLKGLAPKGRVGLAFGSYGWGGQSVGQVENLLKDCNFSMLESIKVQYVPDENILLEISDKIKADLKGYLS